MPVSSFSANSPGDLNPPEKRTRVFIWRALARDQAGHYEEAPMAIRQVRAVNVERARNLLVQAVLDHKDASMLTISPYRRLVAAYETSLHCCLAVLALSKEEVSGSEGHHREIIDRACEILGVQKLAVELLTISKIRNITGSASAWMPGAFPPPARAAAGPLGTGARCRPRWRRSSRCHRRSSPLRSVDRRSCGLRWLR